ncbi:MAG: DegV family protein [Erysipelotrichaceae bacterium]|nr:DegV family protein [Erysipelotrichaceae bacterium]
MKRIVVSDSSSNYFTFPPLNYAYVPLKILVDDKSYSDVEGIDLEEMVSHMEHCKTSSTACPSTGEWLESFEGYDEIIAITISANLSGSYNSAMVAKNEYLEEHPDAKVEVIDSRMTGAGMTMLMEQIIECEKKGLSFEETLDVIAEYRKNLHLCFSLNSLNNLVKAGRVSALVAKLFNVLGLRMLGRASNEGTIEPVNKVRGDKAGIKSIVNEMKLKGFAGGRVRITHTLDEDLAEAVKTAILELWPESDIIISPNTGLCSFYSERHGLIIGYEGGPR